MMTRTWGDLVELRYGRALRDYDRTTLSPVTVYGTNGPIGATDTAISPGPGVIVGRKGAYRGVHYAANPFWVIDTAYFVDPRVEINLKWAYYALLGADINGLGSGSAIPSTTREDFSALPVLVPTRSEQDGIAEVLGAFDDKIAANRALGLAVDAVAEATFTSLCLTSVVPLGVVAEVNRARVQPQSSGHLKYIDIASVGDGTFELPPRSSWVDAPGRARRGVAVGDTVWSTVRPNRRSHALVLDDDPELVASTGLAVLTPKTVGFSYLYQATKTPGFQDYLERVAEGSAYPAVRADRFLNAPVPWADEGAAAMYEERIAPRRKLQHAATVESRCLAKARDALLPLLMSGKLTVKDAEKLAEEVL